MPRPKFLVFPIAVGGTRPHVRYDPDVNKVKAAMDPIPKVPVNTYELHDPNDIMIMYNRQLVWITVAGDVIRRGVEVDSAVGYTG